MARTNVVVKLPVKKAPAKKKPRAVRKATPLSLIVPDVDHFNRDYHPELARGGTEICAMDPLAGRMVGISK